MSDNNNSIEALQQEIQNLRAELDKTRNLAFALNDEAKELRAERDALRGSQNKEHSHELNSYHLPYRIRVATKRTDLPVEIVRLLAEAYAEIMDQESAIMRLESQYGVQYNRAEIMEKERNAFRFERDEARMEVCVILGGGFSHSEQEEAESRGWKYLFTSQNPTYVCDHCAAEVDSDNAFHYAELPRDIASANKGESATLCRKCEEMIDADENNEYFKKNHR